MSEKRMSKKEKQEKMKKENLEDICCPDLKVCSFPITKNIFKRICNSKQYDNCHHYCRRKGFLKIPIAWLQRVAVEEEYTSQETDNIYLENL